MKQNGYFDKHLFKSIQLAQPVDPATKLIVVIPCFNEPDVLSTIESLKRCDKPSNPVEVIVVINCSENADDEIRAQNELSAAQLKKWSEENTQHWLRLFLIREESLPEKHAGVGLARKIGMDEAAFRFSKTKDGGAIVCLDADCTVAPNYLCAIENHYQDFPATNATSVYFEHSLQGLDEIENEGILNYELHLRYYIQALRYCQLPCAHHCVGSSMTVSNDVYLQQGGMNKRKAGEDFHFLQKIIPLGEFYEINNTAVYPSARVSDKVPFGTGKAMGDWHDKKDKVLLTYNPLIFDDLKNFCDKVELLYSMKNENEVKRFINSLPDSVNQFLTSVGFTESVEEIKRNTGSKSSFLVRFYRWFNGLMALKFVHFARDNYYANIPVQDAAEQLLKRLGKNAEADSRMLLQFYRQLDRQKD